jgi:hypothetical protein
LGKRRWRRFSRATIAALKQGLTLRGLLECPKFVQRRLGVDDGDIALPGDPQMRHVDQVGNPDEVKHGLPGDVRMAGRLCLLHLAAACLRQTSTRSTSRNTASTIGSISSDEHGP